MADLANDLKAFLKTVSAVTSIVGTGSDARIYLGTARQRGSKPYIVFDVYRDESYEHLDGISGLCRNRVQIDCVGGNSAQAFTLHEAVRIALQAARTVTMNGTRYKVESAEGYERGDDTPESGSDVPRYYIERDYYFTYAEATS